MGEMEILGVAWCDFVVFTSSGIHVERIAFDQSYWRNKLFPMLHKFYVEHMVPELITGDLWFAAYAS